MVAGSSLTRISVVSLSKNIKSSLVLVQPKKTRPFITERLLMGRKESNQTKIQNSLTLCNAKLLIHISEIAIQNIGLVAVYQEV